MEIRHGKSDKMFSNVSVIYGQCPRFLFHFYISLLLLHFLAILRFTKRWNSFISPGKLAQEILSWVPNPIRSKWRHCPRVCCCIITFDTFIFLSLCICITWVCLAIRQVINRLFISLQSYSWECRPKLAGRTGGIPCTVYICVCVEFRLNKLYFIICYK